MKDLLYVYESESQTTEEGKENNLSEYFKNQYKVKLLMKIVIITSILLSSFLGIIRISTIKKTYTCNGKYSSFLVETISPPFILDDLENKYFAFIDPSYKIKFKGYFIHKFDGKIFGGDVYLPEVFLNDSRFSVDVQYDNCDAKVFFKHYVVCKTIWLKFALLNTNISTAPHPVTVFIKDPDPSYSMYFSNTFNCGCESSFNIILIPLNHQTCFPARAYPALSCDNDTDTSGNDQKLIDFTLKAVTLEEEFYPFIQQKIFTQPEECVLKPVLVESYVENEELIISMEELNVTSAHYYGNQQHFDIITSNNGSIGTLTFSRKVQYQCYVKKEKIVHFIAIPFVFDRAKNSITSAFIAAGLYSNHLKNIEFTIIKSNQFKTTLSIEASFMFYVERLPQIFINNNLSSIVNFTEPNIVTYNQLFRYDTALVECKEFIVEVRGCLSETDVKNIQIKIPGCPSCEFTKYY